jgi:hypothetical protein
MQQTLAPVLPDLDPEVGAQLGDDILLGAASTERVAKVKAVGEAGSRAWSLGGNVD